jgi:5-formyltetrahydrofolate cyclo-ligase
VAIQSKQELRQLILDLIKGQKEEVRLFKSRVIFEKVTALPVFRSARTILFYASFRGEVDTFALMQRAMDLKKRVALPLIRKEEQQIVPMLIKSLTELKSGPYGIQEPPDMPQNRLNADELDLVVVPGVAFDRQNNRLGRGAGYYDRFLSTLSVTTPTIGLAYDLQVVDALFGIEAHDHPVTFVISN